MEADGVEIKKELPDVFCHREPGVMPVFHSLESMKSYIRKYVEQEKRKPAGQRYK